MSSGVVHFANYRRNFYLALLLAWLVQVLVDDIAASAAVIAGYGLGRWIDPDLDLIGITNAESRLMRELKIIGVVVVMWFFPYSYFMRFIGLQKKGHRNFFSHFPGVSTFIRLAWLFGVPVGAYAYLGGAAYPWMLSVFLGLMIGLTLADLIHFIEDMK